MFASVRSAQPTEVREVQKTNPSTLQMTVQLTEIFKKSLKSNRWHALDLGAKDNYTHENMVQRWVVEKNKWLQVSQNAFASRLAVLVEITSQDGRQRGS